MPSGFPLDNSNCRSASYRRGMHEESIRGSAKKMTESWCRSVDGATVVGNGMDGPCLHCGPLQGAGQFG